MVGLQDVTEGGSAVAAAIAAARVVLAESEAEVAEAERFAKVRTAPPPRAPQQTCAAAGLASI